MTLFPTSSPPTQTSLPTLPPTPYHPLPRPRSATNSTRIHIQRLLLTPDTRNNYNIEYPTNTSPLPTQFPSKLTLRHLALYAIPQHPLTILEIYGGTTAGLEALLKTCHHIQPTHGQTQTPTHIPQHNTDSRNYTINTTHNSHLQL